MSLFRSKSEGVNSPWPPAPTVLSKVFIHMRIVIHDEYILEKPPIQDCAYYQKHHLSLPEQKIWEENDTILGVDGTCFHKSVMMISNLFKNTDILIK